MPDTAKKVSWAFGHEGGPTIRLWATEVDAASIPGDRDTWAQDQMEQLARRYELAELVARSPIRVWPDASPELVTDRPAPAIVTDEARAPRFDKYLRDHPREAA